MRRRTFVWLSILAGISIAMPVFIKTRLNARRKPLIIPDVLSHFCDEETIREIGLNYRSRFPAENSRKKLIELLLPGNKESKSSASEGNFDGDELKKHIINEFHSNEIILINGWVLTATEARQCALLSFTKRLS